jgi:hypothetical protein
VEAFAREEIGHARGQKQDCIGDLQGIQMLTPAAVLALPGPVCGCSIGSNWKGWAPFRNVLPQENYLVPARPRFCET